MKPTVISQDTPWGEIPSLLLPAYGETWLMVAIVMLFVVTLGGLVGVVLFNASPRGLFPHALLYRLLNWVVNMGRSLPFLVLMAAIIPFTYWLTGTTIGIPAAVVPMIAAGVPFFGRLVENALRELPAEVTAVGVVCGGSGGGKNCPPARRGGHPPRGGGGGRKPGGVVGVLGLPRGRGA
ncbi:hypothetical protein L1Q27_16045, partial [Klebsiella pneumoniae]